MRSILVLAIVLALSASVFANQPNTDVTSGILDGVAYVAGNPLACNKAHNDVDQLFVNRWHQFSAAFSTAPNVVAFENALTLWGQGIVSLSSTFQGCGLETVVSNFTRIAHQIRSNPGSGVTNFLGSLSSRVSSLHLDTLIPSINRDLDNGAKYTAGVKIGTIIGTILTPNVPADNNIWQLLTILSKMTGH